MAFNIRDYPKQKILKLTIAEDGEEYYIDLFGIKRCERSEDGKYTKIVKGVDDYIVVSESTDEILNRILRWTHQLRRDELISMIR